MDTGDKWFMHENSRGPIWGSRGREFNLASLTVFALVGTYFVGRGKPLDGFQNCCR